MISNHRGAGRYITGFEDRAQSLQERNTIANPGDTHTFWIKLS